MICNPFRADSRLRSGARFSDTYQHGFFLRDAGNLTQDGQPENGNFRYININIIYYINHHINYY